ncbi:hypothetical protein OUZ56_008679 [Daphnia magna]|uniref:HAT C-terminal dimerisation domain-containing protein n=1 Tax=Daphnia magna TaxID=35525 RepID=A0ABR0ADU0_9CRUS|nr:hypothetical protein OUZ56_008679 [Daphnia magna]
MDHQDLLLSDWEWETLAGAAILLKLFDILTQDLSSQYYPSLSKVLPSIVLLQDHLKEIEGMEFNDVLIMMNSALNLNLKYRFNEFYNNTAHTVATYMDPRFKKEYLDPSDKTNDKTNRTPSLGAESAEKRVISEIRRAANRSRQQHDSDPSTRNQLDNNTDDIRCLHDSRISKLNADRGGQGEISAANYLVVISEYLKLPLFPWAKDPLDFWRSKKDEGVLIPMIPVVKQFACIPATSVPSEQVFSKAGDLVRKKRSALSHKHIDLLLFLNKNA